MYGVHSGATSRIPPNRPCAAAIPFCRITLTTCYYYRVVCSGGKGDGGSLRVAKLSTHAMSVEKVWTIPVQHRRFGNGFIACGILYLVRDTRAKTTVVDYAYDMYLQTPVAGVRLSFTNPFEMNNMIAYNPVEKKIYSWDKGNQLVYQLLM